MYYLRTKEADPNLLNTILILLDYPEKRISTWFWKHLNNFIEFPEEKKLF